MTTTAPDSTSIDHAGPAQAGRIRLVAVALAAAALTSAVLVLTHPWGERFDNSADEILSYDTLVTHRDAAWPAMVIDGFAYAVLAIGIAVAVGRLVRERGRVAATIGSAVLVAGGIVFAMGGAAFASLVWFGTGLPEEESREFLEFANDNAGRLIGLEAGGFLLTTLGSLAVAFALFRARAVPRVAIGLYVACLVGLFAGLPMTAMNLVQTVQLLTMGALAIPLFRSASDSAPLRR